MTVFTKYFEKALDIQNIEEIDLRKEFLEAGLSNDFDDDYDETELAMGVIVEMEHTTNKDVARKIAMDHLAERPDYYSFGKKCGIFDELEGYNEATIYDFQQTKQNKDHATFQSFVNEFVDLLENHNLKQPRDLINIFLNELYKQNFTSPKPKPKKQEIIEPEYPEK